MVIGWALGLGCAWSPRRGSVMATLQVTKLTTPSVVSFRLVSKEDGLTPDGGQRPEFPPSPPSGRC